MTRMLSMISNLFRIVLFICERAAQRQTSFAMSVLKYFLPLFPLFPLPALSDCWTLRDFNFEIAMRQIEGSIQSSLLRFPPRCFPIVVVQLSILPRKYWISAKEIQSSAACTIEGADIEFHCTYFALRKITNCSYYAFNLHGFAS